MGISALIPVLIWLGYAILVTLFVRPIAKHALTIYCTRVKDRDDRRDGEDEDDGEAADPEKNKQGKGKVGESHRVRVFLRNLESEPLDAGPYTLRIELHPHDTISDPVVRAGAKCFLENKSKLGNGIWEVYFEDMPPHDTWLFEMDAPTDKCKATITLTPSSTDEKAKIDAVLLAERKDKWPDRSTGTMHRLATSSLVLSHDRAWDIAGSYVTPRWSAVVLLMALSVAAYLIVALMVLPVPESCTVVQPGLTDCPWERFRAHIGWADLWVSLGLVVLTLISTSTGLRRPFPIAQGYLEKNRLIDASKPPDDKALEKPKSGPTGGNAATGEEKTNSVVAAPVEVKEALEETAADLLTQAVQGA